MKNLYPPLLQCPVCGSGMELLSGKPNRVACKNRHSYDVSRWINFLTHPVTDHYTKTLFEARRDIWAAGLFDPLAECLAKHLKDQLLSNSICTSTGMTLLDAGCGEGSPLIRTLGFLSDWNKKIRAIGVDLAKDAIRLAAGAEKEISWLVCDLTRLPLYDNRFDIVLNLLSPACYEEFARILKPGGLLIKVLPEDGYLKEIRELLPEKQRSLSTPREVVTDRLNRHFKLNSSERLTVRCRIPFNMKTQLVRMTPLCADFPDEQCVMLANRLGDSVNVDLTILLAVMR